MKEGWLSLKHINRIFGADRDLRGVSTMRLEIHNKDQKKINQTTTLFCQHCSIVSSSAFFFSVSVHTEVEKQWSRKTWSWLKHVYDSDYTSHQDYTIYCWSNDITMRSKHIAGHALCKYSKQRMLYHIIIMKPNTLDVHIIMLLKKKKDELWFGQEYNDD